MASKFLKKFRLSPLRSAPEQACNALFCIARGSRPTPSFVGVSIEARDVVLLCCRDRLLRLHDLNGVGDAGGEPVSRLPERILGQRAVAFGHSQLLAGRSETKERAPDLEIDAARGIFVFCASLSEYSIRLSDICLDSSPAPDWKVNACDNRKHSVGLSRIHSSRNVTATECDCRSALCFRSLSSLRSEEH